MNGKQIYLSKPFLPTLAEFMPFLEDIWQSKWLTNNGKYHQKFENALCEFLDVPYISLFANGTLALITALQAMRITGEVITTPFTFVATAHALYWNGITPVFVDVENKTCNLDPDRIESAITSRTTAILPVHVYGNPCNVLRIQEIADRYGLKLIYDAAHAFGVIKDDSSILNFGDLSILSFHATKVFNTFEGGAVICHDEKMKKRIDLLKNFGLADEVTVVAPGINAKMNEFQAALGILQLKYYEELVAKRKRIAQLYSQLVSQFDFVEVLDIPSNIKTNYSYFPIFFKTKNSKIYRDYFYEQFKKNGILTRRYFYPLVSEFTVYRGLSSAKPSLLPIAKELSESVLCLPIHAEISEIEIKQICTLLLKIWKEK